MSEGLAQGPYVVARAELNLRPSGRKVLLSHHAPHLLTVLKDLCY